jgi:dolichol-phosphate mannosyltransferase
MTSAADGGHPTDLSIVLPTYNERGHIRTLLVAIAGVLDQAQVHFEVLVVDDASPDGTAAEATAVPDPRVRVLVRQRDRGLATALRHGIEHSRGRALLLMDADFNHQPADIPRLYSTLQAADIVVGSRFLPRGGMQGPAWRYWSSWLVNAMIRAASGSRVRDNTSGFLCLKRDVMAGLDADAIFVGYGDYCIRVLHACQRRGLHIVEVPVMYGHRGSGGSKTRFLSYAWQCLRTVRDIRERQRQAAG